jgi:hypothetical protein
MCRTYAPDDEVKAVLKARRIGPSKAQVLAFLQYDLPAAMVCDNTYEATDNGRACVNIEMERERIELTQSCE